MLWNCQVQSAQLRALYTWRQKLTLLHLFTDLFCKEIFLTLQNNFTKITEVNLSALIYRLFHKDFSLILGTNPDNF